ncbi:hypothetical protein RFI_17737 [Reticulomyxa filosa]|uniref:Hydroxyproline O-arabinosyltransferase-like domain-containing protein n=1 Tax=Reticulomyxa filosa TaxID=46433 RepID=X6N2G1_RETFI|nr:hypothetical protein RFI_17737 [Reticulomyxa filosa]|eukprot:ETO19497.1 hypothetical protein RFI_17737 [Reticulomyxa filosa]
MGKKDDDSYTKEDDNGKREVNRLLRNRGTLYCCGGVLCLTIAALLIVLYMINQGNRSTITTVALSSGAFFERDDVHIVISSGCSEQQNWQSEVLLYSWARLQHPGQITRIVSGCRSLSEKLSSMNTAIVSERVHYYFSPDYTPGKSEEERNSKGGGHPFHYFNKPFGMRKFLDDVDIPESYLVLLDPDMIITKVFDFHFNKSLPEHLQVFLKKKKKIAIIIVFACLFEKKKKVERGTSHIANVRNWDEMDTLGTLHSRQLQKDWRRIVPQWVEYSPGSLEKDPPPSILAEMYSYAMACAHHGLKHQTIVSMVSDPGADQETEPWSQVQWGFLKSPLDLATGIHIVHYCQGYWLGIDRPSGHFKTAGFNFHKGHVPSDILHNCDIPLLVEVPLNQLAFQRDHTPDKRNLWMLYQVINRINSALMNYKHLKCKNWKPEFKTVLLQPERDPLARMHYLLDTDTIYG